MWRMAAMTGMVRVGVWQVEVLQVHGTRSSEKTQSGVYADYKF